RLLCNSLTGYGIEVALQNSITICIYIRGIHEVDISDLTIGIGGNLNVLTVANCILNSAQISVIKDIVNVVALYALNTSLELATHSQVNGNLTLVALTRYVNVSQQSRSYVTLGEVVK